MDRPLIERQASRTVGENTREARGREGNAAHSMERRDKHASIHQRPEQAQEDRGYLSVLLPLALVAFEGRQIQHCRLRHVLRGLVLRRRTRNYGAKPSAVGSDKSQEGRGGHGTGVIDRTLNAHMMSSNTHGSKACATRAGQVMMVSCSDGSSYLGPTCLVQQEGNPSVRTGRPEEKQNRTTRGE